MSDSDELSTLFSGVNIAIFIIAFISVALRCYVRIGITNAFGADDYWMLATLASFTANTTVALLSAKYGLGKHASTLSHDSVIQAKKFSYATEITYGVTMIFAKISIALFLLRITVHRVQKWIIYIITALTCIAGLTLVFIVAFQCKPLSRAWDSDLPGSCITVKAIPISTYTYSALAVVTDLTFTVLPLFIVWNLQMDKRTKLALVPIFSLALLASLAVVIRIPLIPEFAEPDFLYATAQFGIWSAVEQGLAITAGSLITTRPLLRKMFNRFSTIKIPYRYPSGGVQRNSKANSAGADHHINDRYGSWNGQDRRASDAISLRASNSVRSPSDEVEDDHL
ncbi:hypothetical protein O1611_g8425 [Lasiodiplodia mahajangana]|uniref:Uncharacterized protein n=1 Tax=Lasiodiplodia mahajangana TaxID=1108764 RepID=A0ACC2JD91_9PEZI|nr:hypothetical protein O1611_g8425 [Lasiodiplodia mahajangana]